jgi:GTPase SAR1 family protein
MGGCCSAADDDKRHNDDIDDQLNEDRQKNEEIHKLLLLGAGESGKSTLFKQMIHIYGPGWSDKEKRTYIAIIYRNIISSAEELAKQSTDPSNAKRWGEEYVLKDEATLAACRSLMDTKYDDGGAPNTKIPQSLLEATKTLWKDPVVRLVYGKSSEYQLNDTAGYFLDKIDECVKEDYLPNSEDVLKARVRTTGIVENSFEIDRNKFQMYDVGGQRNERKKWIHCFEDVTAVLFVAAISAYNQKLYEDATVDRIDEAFNLFENICNSRWFKATSIILFLNKSDLFAEKIKKVPLESVFGKNYTEWAAAADPPYEDDFSAGTRFVEAQFLARNHYKKPIYTHVTCATDSQNVEVVFNCVKDIVVRGALTTAGLM